MMTTRLVEKPDRFGNPCEQLDINITSWDDLTQKGDVFQCHVFLCPEEEGGYSVLAADLPGVVSQGDTEQEALANIAEAFQATVSLYLEEGQGIPWEPVDVDRPRGCLERWILVDV